MVKKFVFLTYGFETPIPGFVIVNEESLDRAVKLAQTIHI